MRIEILGTPFNGLGSLPDIENPADGLRQAKLVPALASKGHSVTDLGDLAGFRFQEIRDPETGIRDFKLWIDLSNALSSKLGEILERGVLSAVAWRRLQHVGRDMSFSGYARQAGEQQVDMMLNPSFDYPKSTGAMYSLRAIENGFTMIRPVYNGFSYAVDPNGKLLASMDSDNTTTGILYADVPTRGINTLYTKVGDVLGWICVAGLLGFIPLGIILRNRRKKGRALPR